MTDLENAPNIHCVVLQRTPRDRQALAGESPESPASTWAPRPAFSEPAPSQTRSCHSLCLGAGPVRWGGPDLAQTRSCCSLCLGAGPARKEGVFLCSHRPRLCFAVMLHCSDCQAPGVSASWSEPSFPSLPALCQHVFSYLF